MTEYELSSLNWGQEELKAMQRVIDSGMFTMSKEVAQFEKDVAHKMGSRFAIMANSGSSANLIAIASLFYKKETPLKPGDEIIVPALSWSTSFFPLMQYGLKLRFVDINLETLNIDIAKMKEAITPKTKAVMAVNILGNPCELDVISSFCQDHKLYFFEDNCESMGATLNGKQCGTFGDIGTFSTFFAHHISTMEGGIAVTDNEELYHIMLSLRSHGWTRHLPEHSKIYEKREDDFYEAYRFILPGYNVRPLELSGAIGIEQLKKLDPFIKIRRENAEIMRNAFSGDERFILQKEHGKSSWYAFTFILNPELSLNRKKVMQRLKENQIQCRIITGGNFLRHDAAKYCNHTKYGSMKNADIAHDFGFFIGNHPYPLEKKIKHLYQVLDKSATPLATGV